MNRKKSDVHAAISIAARPWGRICACIGVLLYSMALPAIAGAFDGAMESTNYVEMTGDVNNDGRPDVLMKASPKVVMLPIDDELNVPLVIPARSPTFLLLSTGDGTYSLVTNPDAATTGWAGWVRETQALSYAGPDAGYAGSVTISAAAPGQASFVVSMSADTGLLQITSTTLPSTSIGSGGMQSATRTVTYQYEAGTLLPTQETIEPGNIQLQLNKTTAFDVWGNKISVTVSSPATGTASIASRDTSTPFDSNGRFPLSYSDPSGHTENHGFDARHGQMNSRQDIQNGTTNQMAFDAFGRKTLETAADGTKTRWDYSFCSGVNGGTTSCPTYAKYMVQITPVAADGFTANGAWTRIYLDALDREVRTDTLGFDGSSVSVTSTEYNARRQPYRVSQPYFLGQAASWSETYYDELGRVSRTTNPSSTVSYSGLTTVYTNALQHAVTKVLNSRGELVSVIDPANNSLTYSYDAFGNLWKTVDPLGNEVESIFDIRGNRIQQRDPNLGNWVFEYDATGNQVKQTNAKQQVVTRTFDKLNRMLTQSEPDLVSTWTYDICTKGFGRLCKASGSNGYEQTTSYDAYGRPYARSTKVDAIYNESLTFDGNGRVATQTYPNGLVIKNVYTPLGYLSEIRNNATNALYWSANSLDAAGKPLRQTFGNNVLTQQVFDAATGRLRYVYAGVGNSVQNLNFEYDDVGNLKTRGDVNQNFTETFLYDERDRLTTATVNSGGAGTVTQSFTYDSIGNMKTRSAVGTYIYGPRNNRPHAVTSIDWTGVGKRDFYYDANGNLTDEIQLDTAGNVVASMGRKATYTSYNMPSTLATPSASISFMYDTAHQRVKQTAPGVTTVFVHPDSQGGLTYEKDIKADGTVEHRNFITTADQVVAVVTQVNTTSSVRYFHRDYQGSVTAITNEAGAVVERFAYEPFGKRRFATGATDTSNTIKGVNTTRGYTDHEHLDAIGLINMNGRVYNPLVSRFLSPDPSVPHPEDLQSFNRYSYTRNNPLAYDDPSGFDDAQSGQGSGQVVNVSGTKEFDESARALMLAGVPDPVSAMTQQNDAPKPAAKVIVHGPLVAACSQCNRGAKPGQRTMGDAVNDFLEWDPVVKIMEPLMFSPPGTILRTPVVGWRMARVYMTAKAASKAPAPLLLLRAPRQIEAAWGAHTYFDGGLTHGIEHIMYRHGPISGFANVSRFAKGTRMGDVSRYVDSALRSGKVTPNGPGGYVIEYKVGQVIGVTKDGVPTSMIRVLVRDGIIRTAYPF